MNAVGGEVYYGTLKQFADCAAHEIVVRARGELIDPAEPGEALEFLAAPGRRRGAVAGAGWPCGRWEAEG